jgi:hypothetical protein
MSGNYSKEINNFLSEIGDPNGLRRSVFSDFTSYTKYVFHWIWQNKEKIPCFARNEKAYFLFFVETLGRS